MKRSGDTRVKWAFALALLLHGAALAGAARLPVEGFQRYRELETIRVFDASAPSALASVDLVELPGESAAQPALEMQPAIAAPAPPEVVEPTELPEPPARISPPAQPDVSVRTAPREPSPPQTARTPPPSPGANTPPVDAGDPGGNPEAPANAQPGGGGGGGPVAIGSPSEHGDLPGGTSGSTPGGQVPGSGAGSGSGVGPGTGSGTGGGCLLYTSPSPRDRS